jgi:hypothetical protein
MLTNERLVDIKRGSNLVHHRNTVVVVGNPQLIHGNLGAIGAGAQLSESAQAIFKRDCFA